MPETVAVSSLVLNTPLPRGIFAINGEMLASAGIRWTNERLQATKAFGIDTVFMVSIGESNGECKNRLAYEIRNITTIDKTFVLAEAVHDEGGRLLIQQGKPVSPDHTSTLIRQGVKTVTLRRDFDAKLVLAYAKLKRVFQEIASRESLVVIGKEFAKIEIHPDRLAPLDTKVSYKLLTSIEETESGRAIALDPATRAKIEPPRLDRPESDDDRDRVLGARRDLLNETVDVFEAARQNAPVDGKKLGKLIRDVVERIVSDRFHRLHITAPDEEKVYIPSHGLSTLVLAINIAGRMNYAMNELYELGYAALLHQVGMLRVPFDVREKREPLTPGERKTIEAYPGYSLEMCERIRGLPRTAAVVMYQACERMDASGYPRKLAGKAIHPFAKIVMVASTYDALMRERPYRPGKHPYKAMEEVLKHVHTKRFDPMPVKALLETLALFPIASGVQLSDGRYGRVLDSAGTLYTRPVIQVELDAERRPLRDSEIIDLQHKQHETTQIVRAVSPPYDIDAEGKPIAGTDAAPSDSRKTAVMMAK